MFFIIFNILMIRYFYFYLSSIIQFMVISFNQSFFIMIRLQKLLYEDWSIIREWYDIRLSFFSTISNHFDWWRFRYHNHVSMNMILIQIWWNDVFFENILWKKKERKKKTLDRWYIRELLSSISWKTTRSFQNNNWSFMKRISSYLRNNDRMSRFWIMIYSLSLKDDLSLFQIHLNRASFM